MECLCIGFGNFGGVCVVFVVASVGKCMCASLCGCMCLCPDSVG